MKEQASPVKPIIPSILRFAASDADFRGRLVRCVGMTLAEEGFILTNDEMRTLREMIKPLEGLSERVVYERIAALSRLNPR